MSLTRREFQAAAVAVSAASYAQVPGANERLRLGVIGCGGMATAHMNRLVEMREPDNLEIVAVSDVYQPRLEKAAALTGGKPMKDYRQLLDDKSIDYVLIATPEHWHGKMILDALDAGKHIYTEKPMTKTVAEAQAVLKKLNTVPKQKLQVGVQGMSDESYEVAKTYVDKGVLGKVVMAQIDYSRNHRGDFWAYDIDKDARPGENLDWNAWLGSAPKRPFDPERFFRWRRYWDYSGGIASDLFVHRVTRIIKALGLMFPERAVATGGKFQFADSVAEIPDTFNALLDYPGGPTVQLVSSMANDTPVQHLLRGHRATLEFTRTGFTITPQGLYRKEMEPIVYEKKGAESVVPHHRNLHAAIRRGDPLKCDAQLGYYGVVACEMTVTSFRKRQYLSWDSAKNRIVRA